MTERDHLDPATIAALVDRTLEPAARAAAEAHLAACADCREVWVETSEMAEDVVAARPKARRWIFGAAGLAAAAAVVMAVAGGWFLFAPSSAERALRALQPPDASHRMAAGRFAIPFPYLPAPETQRGAAAAAHPASVRRSALLLQERAEREPSTEALRHAAIAHLAVGETASAIDLLTAAASGSPDEAAVHTDFSAVLLERWRESGEATDALRALDEAKRAVLLDAASAPAQFNLALAYAAVGLTTQARAAFEQFLRLEPASAWADEARRRLQRLDEDDQTDATSLSRLYRDLETNLLPSWMTAVAEGRPVDRDILAASARRLGNRDGALAIMLRRAADTGRTPPAVRHCAAAAAAAIAQWSIAFDEGRSEDAHLHADAAMGALTCAGMPVLDAESRKAISLIELNRLPEANAVAGRVLADPRLEAYPRAGARAWQVRGLAALQQTRWSEAVEAALQAADAAHRSGDAEFEAALQTQLADLFSKQGDVRRAWLHLSLALQGESQLTSARRRYAVLGRALLSAMEVGLPGAALAFSDALIERTEGWANPVGRAFAHIKRAELLTTLGHRPDAARALERGRALAREVRSDAVRANLQAQIDVTAGLLAQEPASGLAPLDAAASYFAAGGNRMMLAPVLLARGRLHERAGHARRAEEDWRAGVEIVERERRHVQDEQLQISRLDRMWELFEELTSVVAETRPIEALEIAEQGRARQLAETLVRRGAVASLRGEALYRWLPAGTDALVYATLPDRLLIWHATATSLRLTTRAITRDALERAVARFRTALQRASGTSIPVGGELAALLLPDDMPARTSTLIVADGPLHLMPFAAIRAPDGRLLGERALVAAPSLSTAASLSLRPESAARSALVINGAAGPQPDDLPRLPGAEREVKAVAALYPAATVLAAPDATAVMTALADRTLVHFAGHAIADAMFPARSRLVLGAGQALTASQIAGVRLPPGTVVVLGACDTANGHVARGEGPLALSRAFTAAGASSVVGALWKLNDEEGQRFLLEFHRRLASFDSAPAALAATRQAWIQAGGAPSVWASFQVTGALLAARSADDHVRN